MGSFRHTMEESQFNRYANSNHSYLYSRPVKVNNINIVEKGIASHKSQRKGKPAIIGGENNELC